MLFKWMNGTVRMDEYNKQMDEYNLMKNKFNRSIKRDRYQLTL